MCPLRISIPAAWWRRSGTFSRVPLPAWLRDLPASWFRHCTSTCMIDPVLTFLIFSCDFHVECSVHPKFLKDIPVFLLLLWATHAGCFLLEPPSLLVTVILGSFPVLLSTRGMRRTLQASISKDATMWGRKQNEGLGVGCLSSHLPCSCFILVIAQQLLLTQLSTTGWLSGKVYIAWWQ